MSREAIGYIMYRELPDDDKPLMETHAFHFMPVTDTDESDESHTRAKPWSAWQAGMNAKLGFGPVLVVRADVERVGTKIIYTNYNCHLVEGLPADLRANVKRLVTPDMFQMMLDRFYDDLIRKRKANHE